MEFSQSQENCRHQNMKLCDDCGKPMCGDCGASCGCDHSHQMKHDKQQQ